MDAHADDPDRGAKHASTRGLFAHLVQFVEETFGAADTLIDIYADRLRLSARSTLVHAGVAAGAAVFMAIVLGASALAIVRGLRGGLTALWGGREWLGDLTGGVLALALAAGVIALMLRLSSRRELRRLTAKYAKHSNDDTTSRRT